MSALRVLTKSAAVAERLKQDITAGVFQPGDRLVLRDLSERYGVSQIPIREALAALASDGFVEIKPHVGARVATISEEEVRETQFIRSHLEALAVEAAAPHLTEADFNKLEELMRRMDLVAARGDASTYAALNREFHGVLYQTCPYKRLLQMIDAIWQEGLKFGLVFALEPERMAQSSAEHRVLIRALRRGDAAGARQLMLEHKFGASEALLAHMNQQAGVEAGADAVAVEQQRVISSGSG